MKDRQNQTKIYDLENQMASQARLAQVLQHLILKVPTNDLYSVSIFIINTNAKRGSFTECI